MGSMGRTVVNFFPTDKGENSFLIAQIMVDHFVHSRQGPSLAALIGIVKLETLSDDIGPNECTAFIDAQNRWIVIASSMKKKCSNVGYFLTIKEANRDRSRRLSVVNNRYDNSSGAWPLLAARCSEDYAIMLADPPQACRSGISLCNRISGDETAGSSSPQ